MIQAARTFASATGGAAFLIAAAFGGSPEAFMTAAGLLALAAASRVFGAGTEGIPPRLRPWLPLVSGLALGSFFSPGSATGSVVACFTPAMGLLSAWPDSRAAKRFHFFALAGGVLGFLAAVSRSSPHGAVLAAFWAAAAYPAFPKLSLGLWGGAMAVGLRAGDGMGAGRPLDWAFDFSWAMVPALCLGLAALLPAWGRAGGRVLPILWLAPALVMGEWPTDAFFPLAAAAGGSVLALGTGKFPVRPLWVLPSAWNPAASTPRFTLGPGRVFAASLMALAGARVFALGAAARGPAWVYPVDSRMEKELRMGLRFRPLDAQINIRLAELALGEDRFSLAEETLGRVRGERPRPATWWRVQGQLRFRSGDIAGGLVHAVRGILEDPQDPQGYAALGEILSGLNPALAATVLVRGLQACPGQPGLLKGLAAVYEGMGKARAALPLYGAALSVDPRDVESLRGICRTSYVRGEEAETRSYLNRLRQLTPNDPWVHRYLQRLDQP